MGRVSTLSSGHVVEARDSMKVFKPESGLKSIKFGFLLTTEVNSGDVWKMFASIHSFI